MQHGDVNTLLLWLETSTSCQYDDVVTKLAVLVSRRLDSDIPVSRLLTRFIRHVVFIQLRWTQEHRLSLWDHSFTIAGWLLWYSTLTGWIQTSSVPC